MIPVGPKISFSGSRATIENATLGNLIDFAYGSKFESISGAPHWVGSDRFDITARAESERVRTKDEFRQMFQTLLAERFMLKFHLDTKKTRGYSLIVAKNGPKLKKSAPDAESSMSMRSPGNAAEMTVTKWTMAQLATQLSFVTGQSKSGAIVPASVVDATALAGTYDFILKWSDDQSADADPGEPSLFTALVQELRLKLEPRQSSTQILVIDSATRPSAN
jgi:uncharacterized protein (TIGR03435 family)